MTNVLGQCVSEWHWRLWLFLSLSLFNNNHVLQCHSDTYWPNNSIYKVCVYIFYWFYDSIQTHTHTHVCAHTHVHTHARARTCSHTLLKRMNCHWWIGPGHRMCHTINSFNILRRVVNIAVIALCNSVLPWFEKDILVIYNRNQANKLSSLLGIINALLYLV